jgi:hypothetical protein
VIEAPISNGVVTESWTVSRAVGAA